VALKADASRRVDVDEVFGIVGALLALPVAAMYPCVEDIWLRDYLGRDAVETHRRIEREA
jgi:hypothetical protein